MPSRESSIPGLEAARAACERCDWQDAYDQLSAADARGELDGEGLELLADCARWTGRSRRVIELLERAHHAYRDDPRGAARTALALCYAHMDACEAALATSWWRRADGLIASLPEGPEHGLHAWFAGRACGGAGDHEGHEQHAQRAVEIARRCGDRNVEALGLIDLAHIAAARGHSSKALELVDRSTALALGGEIGIFETGYVYCNAIYVCRSRGDWDRAEEWTASSSRWVERTRVSYFPGLCRVHRAEVLRIRGELVAAEVEAQEAEHLLRTAIPRWTALGAIELGEVRRRRGDLAGSFEAFRAALETGWDPQPGLALVVLAQGDARAAHGMIERFQSARVPVFHCEDRAGLALARVTIAIAAGEREAAAAAVADLAALTAGDSISWDRAAYAQGRGELALATGDQAAAIEHLREARSLWAELDAPYELGTSCMRLGTALARAGDVLGAKLELETGRGIFERLGAALDRAACAAELSGLEPGGALGARPRRPASGPARAGLRREGDYWTLWLDDATVRLKDGRGPRYLARLLSSPGREVLALQLAAGASGPVIEGDAGEVLDGKARAAYRARLEELRAELDEATDHGDIGRTERHRAELEALTSQLAAAVGLGGRARRAGNAVERARQSVTKAIRATLRKVADSQELLGRYLCNTIRTGTTCCFEPDPGMPVHWQVEA